MRIALFTETFLPKVDGVVTITLQMLRHLRAHGHDVIIFGPPSAPHEALGYPVYPAWGPRFPLYPELYCSLPTPAGVRAIRAFQPQIIHVMNPTFIGTAGVIMAKIGHVPLIASVHMDIPHYVTQYAGAWGLPIAWAFFRLWHNRALLTLAPSHHALAQITAGGIKRGQHWRRGIDLERFRVKPRNHAMRQRLSNGHPDDLVALYVGRLSREKSIASLIPLTQMPGVRLALVGGGPESAIAHGQFAHTNAHFTGVLQGEELIDAYNAADIFVFPSQSETFGLAPVEAMACGLPVVAPFVGGLQETLRHGQNSLVYDPNQPDALSDAVTLLRDNPELRQTIAQQAIAYASQQSWQASMDQLIAVYAQHVRT
jgi:glycosyltransferase involved in cell wall biosynthesis